MAAPAAPDDVLDAAVLDELAQLGMGETFEREFIAQCLSDATASVASIERVGANGDWDALREHAHALKGVASNVGLLRVAALSGEMMGLAEWQLAREWRQHAGTLRERLRQVPPVLLVGLGAVLAALLVWGGVEAYRTYDYVQHDNDFCLSCHLMVDPYERFARSAHADLGCNHEHAHA